MRIVVTGARGFVGAALCKTLQDRGDQVVAVVRNGPGPGETAAGDIHGETDWSAALEGADAVIHLAARVHVMSDTDADPLRAYREVNHQGTVNLARQAAAAGVKRFVFVSSVKVNGESTPARPFKASDAASPVDPYGISKYEAENALRELGRETAMEIVIVRPPLVYGPGVKANFLSLVKAVDKGLPLPLGKADGRRSMVAVDNLVDLLIRCTRHPGAAGGTFLVSDGVDLTVRELVVHIANAMNKSARLLPVPSSLMRGAAKLLGKGAVADRLLGSLQVDIDHTRQRLEWNPVVSPELAIGDTVAHFLANRRQTTRMKRSLDILLGVSAMLVFLVPFLVLALLVKLTSKGPVLYWSDRVGRDNRIFSMPKLRTMRVDTPVVATHLLENPDQFLTPIGGFLRRSSLDEIPQLWCIVRGDMSVVGPRPALFNQQNLIEMRTEKGVHVIRPGLTGWAQINGRDELPLTEKVKLDLDYLRRQSLAFDVKVIFLTLLKVVRREGITH